MMAAFKPRTFFRTRRSDADHDGAFRQPPEDAATLRPQPRVERPEVEVELGGEFEKRRVVVDVDTIGTKEKLGLEVKSLATVELIILRQMPLSLKFSVIEFDDYSTGGRCLKILQI